MRGICGQTTIHRLALSTMLVAGAAASAAARPLPATGPSVAAEDEEQSPEEQSPEEPEEEGAFGPPVAIEEERVRRFSLTFSPIHLAQPFIEVTGELRVGQDLGLAAIVGTGSVKSEDSEDRNTIYELGAQARYYVVGDFTKGVMVGIEAIYQAAYEDTSGANIEGEGVTVGGYGGYKHLFDGITLDLQLGVQVVAIRTETSEKSKAGALVNINVGYTF